MESFESLESSIRVNRLDRSKDSVLEDESSHDSRHEEEIGRVGLLSDDDSVVGLSLWWKLDRAKGQEPREKGKGWKGREKGTKTLEIGDERRSSPSSSSSSSSSSFSSERQADHEQHLHDQRDAQEAIEPQSPRGQSRSA